jgi:hypothetical protein
VFRTVPLETADDERRVGPELDEPGLSYAAGIDGRVQDLDCGCDWPTPLAQRPEFRGCSFYLPDKTCPAYCPWEMVYPAVKSVFPGTLLDNHCCTLGSHDYLTTWALL